MYTINAHAKVNIFLKITGHKEGYHTLISRFMRVDDLYDTITFEPCIAEEFSIEGCEGVPLESNTIYKAYQSLKKYTKDPKLENFFKHHKVIVTKRIPSQAGLGGGSSDAAAFMRLCNEVCNLGIDTPTLSQLGSQIGADLPFFIQNYPSANVSGFGEIVEPFEEETLHLELFTPKIGCDTTVVYKTFKKHLLDDITLCSFTGWEKIDSRTLLETIADPIILNDLYAAALIAYPELGEVPQAKEGWFFSGSGSTFFRIKN
ncbi:4-(cytidine 5'-diphospho)-2-C-methyl-D-erythritol kinase [Sulfurovum sp. zt1-1]|uniref:4-diphosphocytidyl-2-C-methyl-D-erythritol kinase n=1 Tax=Sulfurovum zhangzhouensis TaxID=3019067 RepID=A0ABT7QZI1_9BACT|nr:4-(cytidine 5'-diphospho)-2-C-methyl-D-erythritol kinase [Sulfurovum zhangzhouensis]MDM5272197.1 4-(cytidine 5'-diphospho)-2-C-methyl-D-erythritol kinase [Sulfurovum zhangzhouensis]